MSFSHSSEKNDIAKDLKDIPIEIKMVNEHLDHKEKNLLANLIGLMFGHHRVEITPEEDPSNLFVVAGVPNMVAPGRPRSKETLQAFRKRSQELCEIGFGLENFSKNGAPYVLKYNRSMSPIFMTFPFTITNTALFIAFLRKGKDHFDKHSEDLNDVLDKLEKILSQAKDYKQYFKSHQLHPASLFGIKIKEDVAIDSSVMNPASFEIENNKSYRPIG